MGGAREEHGAAVISRMVCVVAALASSSPCAAVSLATGNDAYRLCLNTSAPDDGLSPREELEAYLAGVLIGFEDLIASSQNICAPQVIDPLQATDLFCSRLAAHPDTRHRDWRELFFLTLVEAFPCR
jgi:hypothetical protein